LLSEGFHEAVLVEEVLRHLAPRAGGRYLDLTLGGGGHAAEVLRRCDPDGSLWGVDQDAQALAAAQVRLAGFGKRVRLEHCRFDELPELWEGAGRPLFQGIYADLGVSGNDLDDAARGFSLQRSGPLDMRMDQRQPTTAASLLRDLDEVALADVLRRGEVPGAGRLARLLHEAARRGELDRTDQLADLVLRHSPPRGRKGPGGGRSHHPATLVFQALRLEVNQELPALERLLAWLPEPLAPGGVVVVLSYHSLEDRRVKRRFAELSRGCICPPRLPVCGCGRQPVGRLLTTRGEHAGPAEIARNPRSRSAVLRAWMKELRP